MREYRYTTDGVLCCCVGCSREPQSFCLLGCTPRLTTDNWAGAGWTKCRKSGIYYHQLYDSGCGICLNCEVVGDAV